MMLPSLRGLGKSSSNVFLFAVRMACGARLTPATQVALVWYDNHEESTNESLSREFCGTAVAT
jgi:hypothetical protein